MPEFVPAIQLNHEFYEEVVGPALAPWPHCAGLLGWGSQVLGYDSDRSTDHGWGPRVEVFVAGNAVKPARAAIDAALPETFRGWPVRYGWDDWPERHYVEITTLERWLTQRIGCDPAAGMTAVDWLVIPQQQLLGVGRGAVYHDEDGALAAVRKQLGYFPDDVWRWLVMCQWRRLEQEEAFVGRTAEVGDELGSQVLGARIVRELMRLHFLYARDYWPYTKWFGTAYAALPGSAALIPALQAAATAPSYADRERALVPAYEALMRMHNESGLTEPIDATVRPFHGRPFLVPFSERIVAALHATIRDESLRALPLFGSIDQCVDCTDVVSFPEYATRLRGALHRG